MFRNFQEAERYILERNEKKRVALCGAHDRNALEALVYAHRKGVVDATLIGDAEQIRAHLSALKENAGDYEILDVPGERDSSELAVSLVREGLADIEMKGQMPSTEYLLPIMNPFTGLVDFDSVVSETTVFYYPDQDRLLFATDCALNISPNLEEKRKLIRNAVELARAFGFERVNVAAISALEKVNPQIPSTEEGAQLAEMDWGPDVCVAGPFALDNALDVVTARHKGIENPVAGCADVLLMPDLCTGNVFHKCLHYFGHLEGSGVICGTNKPVVFTSRSDSAEAKYNAIVSAILQSFHT